MLRSAGRNALNFSPSSKTRSGWFSPVRTTGAALVAVAILASPATALTADQPSVNALMARDGSHDFDFDFGVWHTEITRRLDPLSGSTEEIKLSGTVTIRKIWGGKAQIEEIEQTGRKAIGRGPAPSWLRHNCYYRLGADWPPFEQKAPAPI